MERRIKGNLIEKVFMCTTIVLGAATLYLFYQNRMAEDMIRELNRDYEEVVRKLDKTE